MTDSLGLGPLFAATVANPAFADPVPLDAIAARVAQLDDRAPPVDDIIGRLDALAAAECEGIEWVDDLTTVVFGALGFRGNTQQYNDPANSYLHRVLDRRLGIPITLSIVVIALAQRIDIDLLPIGMPGHFLFGEGAAGEPCWFDPMAGGRRLYEPEARAFFSTVMPDQPFHHSYLFPIEPAAVAMRLLNNLRAVEAQRGNLRQLARILDAQIELPGAPTQRRVERAQLFARSGRFDAAITDLEALAVLEPQKADGYRSAADRLRANFN